MIQFIRETKGSKLALWGLMLAMGISVLFYSEVAFLSPSDRSRPHFSTMKWWLVPHILCGVIALFSGAFQFSTRLRNQNAGLHRRLGKIYVLTVLIGASMAAYIDLTFDFHGKLMVDLGYLSHPFAWGLTALVAYRTAVTRNFIAHRQWMIRSYLVTFTFVLVRLPNPIRRWREMSDPNFSMVLALLMFLCYFGADVAMNWREVTIKRGAQTAI